LEAPAPPAQAYTVKFGWTGPIITGVDRASARDVPSAVPKGLTSWCRRELRAAETLADMLTRMATVRSHETRRHEGEDVDAVVDAVVSEFGARLDVQQRRHRGGGEASDIDTTFSPLVE